MAALEPRPTTGARVDMLTELTHGLWKELTRRGESLPSSWVEQAAQDLARGTLHGWYASSASGAGALAFFSVRGSRAYGHVHVADPGMEEDTSARLVERMIAAQPFSVARLDVGVTGLPPAGERHLGESLRARDGVHVLFRWAMHRPLELADATPPEIPRGLSSISIAATPLEQLTDLDVRAFRGSPDESLVAESFDEDRRVLSEILEGLLGRFLVEASRALVSERGELVGALLTGEQTSRTAVYLDLIVDPAYRRRGVGNYLARWGFRALLALGYESVRLWVTESNAPARALYERLGFHKVDQAIIFRWDRPGPPKRL